MSRERIVGFGDATALMGIVSEAAPDIDPGRPAFLILNAGVLHRVGPARLHVALARKLADAGFTALRFDFSGIGDSEPRKDSLPFDARAVLEVQEAMDYLKRTRGIERFVLFGLCSGADVAFLVAKADPRVVGHVSIDGFAYRTFGYYLHYYGPRLLKPRSWAAFAGRHARGMARLARRLVSGSPTAPSKPAPVFGREFPPRAQARADLASLAGRGVHQFFIYSGGHERWYNHAGQFDRMFFDIYFNGRLRVRYLGDADHTFPDLRKQDALTTEICTWASRVWADPAVDRAPDIATDVTWLQPAAVAEAEERRA